MKGTVKWFDSERGYGFIMTGAGADYYFHARGVVGAWMPVQGDVVTFEPRSGKKGPRAEDVRFVERGTGSAGYDTGARRADDRVECGSCHRRMVPRIIVRDGHADHSVCPFCGTVYKDFTLFGMVLSLLFRYWKLTLGAVALLVVFASLR